MQGQARFALVTVTLSAAAVAVALAFPVYFRADDAVYLEWAATHATPLEALLGVEPLPFGVYRPVLLAAWWWLYRLFGTAPLPYQIVTTALLFSTVVLFAGFVRRLHGGTTAVLAVGWWLAAFPFLPQVAFWFSDLSFLLQTTLMLVALHALVSWLEGTANFLLGVVVWLLAVGCKEPALLIVPAVTVVLVWQRWPSLPLDRRRVVIAQGGLLAGGALVGMLFHPSVAARAVVVPVGAPPALVGEAVRRLAFYAHAVLGGVGGALPGLAIWALLDERRRWRSAWGGHVAWLVLGAAGAVAARLWPGPALVLLLAAPVAVVGFRGRAAAGAAWFVVPFVALAGIAFTVRTYLFEPSFGMAWVAGCATKQVLERLGQCAARLRVTPRWRAALAGLVALAALPVAAPKAVSRLAVLRTVVAVRQNFHELVDVLVDPARVPAGTLVVIEYADLGRDYVADILPLPDAVKAVRQKTMEGRELGALLRVAGRGDLAVTTFAAARGATPPPPAQIVIMSREELEFVRGAGVRCDLWVSATRGREVAGLCELANVRPDAG